MEPSPVPPAEHFDEWYTDMTTSPVRDEILQRHLGLPAHLLSTSVLGWEGIAEAVAALRLSAAGTLVDLACGRGRYGLEIAGRTGALRAFHEEGVSSLPMLDLTRRVMASATAP